MALIIGTLTLVDAEGERERQRRQDVRGVEHAQRQLVAHVGPRHFAADLDLQPLALVGAELLGQHDRRAVDDRDEPDLDFHSLQIGHSYALHKQKASRSVGRAADRARTPLSNCGPTLVRALNQERTRHWVRMVRGSMKRAKRRDGASALKAKDSGHPLTREPF